MPDINHIFSSQKTILTGKIKANIYEHFTCYHVPRHNMEKNIFLSFFLVFFIIFCSFFSGGALNININCYVRLVYGWYMVCVA